MPKYQQYFQEMVEYNKEVFDEFKAIHDEYLQDPKIYHDLFNDKGEKILRIIRRYENMLCGKAENSGYSKFSTGLSDKFWGLIRNYLPKIDDVGNR